MLLLVVAATQPELDGVDGLDGVGSVEALVCGVGPVDAAAATARRLAQTPLPTAVLHIGIAGCRRGSDHQLGDVVIGDAAVYCDSQSPLVVQRTAPDPALLARVCDALPGARIVTIGTSADVGGSNGCDVEAMEGFSVLRAAALAYVPAIEVRAIANEVEQSDRGRWRFDLALEAVAATLPVLVPALTRR